MNMQEGEGWGMKLVYAVFADGLRTLLFVAGADFDAERWFESRKAAAKMLGVTRVVVEVR